MQPECTCETAPILCSVDELDGYVFSMSPYMHPEDGPTPICQSEPSSQTNNPTWFAFTAWCSDLTLRARPSNCQQVSGVVGVQIAIYEDCTFTNAVACDGNILDCNTGTKVLTMTGLTIGGVYYFMVDGCLGSYCTVTIDVVGICGEEEIEPWTLPVTGETHPCVGDTQTYTVQSLNGAALYHWFLDGVLIDQSPSGSFSMTWITPGTYQLCIDASHDPCVPISDDPSPLCVNIVVHEADAGFLNVSSSLLCLNEIAILSSSGYPPGADNTQIFLITDAAGNIVYVSDAPSGIFTSGISGVFTIYAYNYVTAVGIVPTIESNINEIDCGLACCDLVSKVITFQGIVATISNILCHNNGTDNDPGDDTFTFDVLVSGQTPGTLWQSSDGTLGGTYGSILNCGPYLINGGSLNLELHDFEITTCLTSISVTPPSTCSVCLQTLDAGPGSTINCIDTSAILVGSASAVGTYTWIGPGAFFSNALTTTVSDSGWYYLTVDFPNQCSFADSVYVDMDTQTPVADAGPDQVLDCSQPEVFIDGSASTGEHLEYVWTNANGLSISTQTGFSIDTPGIYTLHLTNVINGCFSIDAAEVTVDPDMPQGLAADVSDERCFGDSNGNITVTHISGGVGPYSYTLNGLETNISGQFTNLDPGDYILQITDSEGCMLDTFFTILPGIDLHLELVPVIELIGGHTGFIEANVNVAVEDLGSVQWRPPGKLTCDTCLITSITTFENTLFHLMIVHHNGCSATAEMYITVIPETEIYIPNVFSPNGDGYNDYFTLYANERVDMILKLRVYDRWGELVFHSSQFSPNDESAGWNGTFKGKDMMPSIFTYSIEILLADGSSQTLSGDITLIR